MEAAHIRPYRGKKDNHPSNGLLLRADIHTLFDLNLVAIDPETLKIQFHHKVIKEYEEYDGQKAFINQKKQLSIECLRWRFDAFKMNK